MGLLLRSLTMLLIPLTVCFFRLSLIMAQSTSNSSARELDALLQDYAYRAFVRPRTGIAYNGTVPSNLTGIKIAAMRLRSGSLRRRGVRSYKEFEIPIGVKESPWVERLVLVYQNLGNWSRVYYPLNGYTYLAPVLGLLAYDASNLSATNLPELDIRASGKPILIKFRDLKAAPPGSVIKCVWFNLQGSVNMSNTVSGNTCSTSQQGHFAIVVESIAPSPAPVSPEPSAAPPSVVPVPTHEEHKATNKKVWIIVGSVVGGLALLALLSFLAICAHKFKQKRKMQRMERESELGESLRMTLVGETKAPSATGTRTQPVLESEYVP